MYRYTHNDIRHVREDDDVTICKSKST